MMPHTLRALVDEPEDRMPDTILRVSLILILLHGSTNNSADIVVRILCGAMLVAEPLLRNRLAWALMTLALTLANLSQWATIDNHKYLILYWCMACTLASGARDPTVVLATNGRLLLGLAFLFAVSWKLFGGQYLDGSFLHFTFLQDPRIQVAARYVGALTPDVLPGNRALQNVVKLTPSEITTVTLVSSDRLALTARIASLWTLAIEAAVAVAFLMPGHWKLARLAHVLLLVFICTTYFLLPVTGFAFVLGILGLAQCTREQRATRAAYFLLLLGIQLTRFPWQKFLDEIML